MSARELRSLVSVILGLALPAGFSACTSSVSENQTGERTERSAHGHGDHEEHDEHADPHEAEGRVRLEPAAVANGDIRAGAAGARLIEERVEAPGEVRLDAEHVVQVRPRFAGVLQRLEHRIGDTVAPGDLLAVVLSNESLTEYEIRAPMAGTVVAREAAVGQAVEHESVLYTIANLSSVWVDFALYPQMAGRVRRGQTVVVRSAAGAPTVASGVVGYVGPLLEQDTRVSYGRVVLSNPDGGWPPGLFVTVAVTLDRARVAVAVPEAGGPGSVSRARDRVPPAAGHCGPNRRRVDRDQHGTRRG